ncbi:hypothetical protein D9M73_232160 [compost metagenome]
MQVGLADDLPASVENRIHHFGAFCRRRCIGKGTAARAGRMAGDVDGVLDGDALAVAPEEEFADESTHAFSSVLNSRCVRKCAISQVPSTQRKSMFRRVPNCSLR